MNWSIESIITSREATRNKEATRPPFLFLPYGCKQETVVSLGTFFLPRTDQTRVPVVFLANLQPLTLVRESRSFPHPCRFPRMSSRVLSRHYDGRRRGPVVRIKRRRCNDVTGQRRQRERVGDRSGVTDNLTPGLNGLLAHNISRYPGDRIRDITIWK